MPRGDDPCDIYRTSLEIEANDLRREVGRLKPLADFGADALVEIKEAVAAGGFEVEVEQLADWAVNAGLMQYVPYDPVKHGPDFEIEPGDKFYFWGEEIK